MMLGTGIIGAGYSTDAVTFDGAADFLSRGASIGADGKKGILSVWLKFNGNNASLTRVVHIPNGLILSKLASNLIRVQGQTSAGIDVLNLDTVSTVNTSSGWVHVLSSWDLSTASVHLYLNDAANMTVNTNSNTNIHYTGADCTIGAQSAGGLFKLNADMADIYINVAEYLDFSVAANRKKFVRSGRPVDLGANGARPTGNSPAVFLKAPAATFNINLGTAGNFTLTGALTNASTHP